MVTFLIAPASGTAVLSKLFVLFVGAGFTYVGVWMIGVPIRYEIYPLGDEVIIRRARLIGSPDQQSLVLNDLCEIQVVEVTGSDNELHYRVKIKMGYGSEEDPLPNLSKARAGRAKLVLEGLRCRSRAITPSTKV